MRRQQTEPEISSPVLHALAPSSSFVSRIEGLVERVEGLERRRGSRAPPTPVPPALDDTGEDDEL